MRVLIFHGYMLRGTGSNIYNVNLAPALARLGHEVHLLCQDREVKIPGVQIHNPDIGGLLPVYVKDPYEGFEVKTFDELTEAELDRYIDSNVAAVREVAAQVGGIDAALANHLVMGPAILARAGVAPFAAKIHGSALEYTVKPHPRFLPYAYEGMEAAQGVLVGSAHTGESLWAALPDLPGPEGQDPARPARRRRRGVRPRRGGARPAGRLRRQADRLQGGRPAARRLAAGPRQAPGRPPPGRRLRRLRGRAEAPRGGARPRRPRGRPRRRRGGLGAGGGRGEAAADPLRLPRRPARGLRRGGPRRRRLGRVDRPARARRGRGALPQGRRDGDAEHLPGGVRDGRGRGRLLRRAAGLRRPLGDARGLRPPRRRPRRRRSRRCVSFPVEPGAVEAIADRLDRWLDLPETTRAEARATLVETVARLWSWEGVARGVLDAAAGNLGGLPVPTP